MDQRSIKDEKPYNGSLFPEGKKRANWGSHWYDRFNLIKLLKDENSKPIYGDTFIHGHNISRIRHKETLDGYQPRFQRKLIQSPTFIGKGSYGKVYKVKFSSKSEDFALKVVPSDKYPEDIWKERDVLIHLKHKRVVNLVGAFHQGGSMFFVLELCWCALNQKLRDLSNENQHRFTIQMTEAVAFLHSKNIIHCDVKPDNFLITSSNNIVLSDFGAAIILESGLDTVKSTKIRGVAGYQDLEANRDLLYSKSADIFALGCVIFEIWQGSCLLRYSSYTFAKNQEHERMEYARVVEKGRILNIRDFEWPFDNAERMKLEERVARSTILPSVLVLEMIKPRTDRFTAEQVLESGVINNMRRQLERKNWNLDEGTDWVLKDVLIADNFEKFKSVNTSSHEQDAAYIGIYFDEEEMQQQNFPIPTKSLFSYDTYFISNFIKRQGLEELVFDGLVSASPTRLADIRRQIQAEFTAGFLGRNERFPAAGITDASHTVEESQENTMDQVRDAGRGPSADKRSDASRLVSIDSRVQPSQNLETAPADASSEEFFEQSADSQGLNDSLQAPFTQLSSEVTVVPETQPEVSSDQPSTSSTAAAATAIGIGNLSSLEPATPEQRDQQSNNNQRPPPAGSIVEHQVSSGNVAPEQSTLSASVKNVHVQQQPIGVMLPPPFPQTRPSRPLGIQLCDVFPDPAIYRPEEPGNSSASATRCAVTYVPIRPRDPPRPVRPSPLTVAPSSLTALPDKKDDPKAGESPKTVFKAPAPIPRRPSVLSRQRHKATDYPFRTLVTNVDHGSTFVAIKPVEKSKDDLHPVPSPKPKSSTVTVAPTKTPIASTTTAAISKPSGKKGASSSSSNKNSSGGKGAVNVKTKEVDNKGQKKDKKKDDEKDQHEHKKGKHGSSKASSGEKDGRKRKRSTDEKGHSKKKSKKDAKSDHEDDDEDQESDEDEISAYKCPHCDVQFDRFKTCKHHIKHECKANKNKKKAKKTPNE